MGYLIKSFNTIREEDVKAITESDVLEYIDNKDKPP